MKNVLIIDDRITSTCFELGDWPLSRVFLKDNAQYPWFILVPRVNDAQEIQDLSQELGHQLIDEIRMLSVIVETYFKPHKLNVGYLGNIVSQLHIHVVGRFTSDPLWPHGIWQASQETVAYDQKVLIGLLKDLKVQISNFIV